MDWRVIAEFFVSAGYGLLSSFVPVFNSEVYIVAAQALGSTMQVTAAVGVATGQVVGKTAIVLALRHGTRIRFLSEEVDKLRERVEASSADNPAGRARRTLRRWSRRLLDLVGHPRWGALVVFFAGLCTVPPIFASE